MKTLSSLLLISVALYGQTPATGKRYPKLLIKNVIVVEGNGTPAQGPKDILIEGDTIAAIYSADGITGANSDGKPPAADAVIDGKGRYVLPGLINLHGHLQEERAFVPMPRDYVMKLWLANGITTVRDVGSPATKTLEYREMSKRGEIACPRLFVYPTFGRVKNREEAVKRIKTIKDMGADGVKFLGTYRDTLQAAMETARALNLRSAHHIGVEETTAWDAIELGVSSIEHWYGIPDAAIPDKVQNFPSTYNYQNEADRFRYAGRLWREADPKLLDKVLDAMVAKGVAWDPTLDIYEASRDLVRAQSQPWFKEFLHPALEEFFAPNLSNHGSYFVGWSSTDEKFWKDNYRIWFRALRDFERKGGVIGMGDDAGFIYTIYGFGMVRNLELHQEAGFHPLKVIQHATSNGAKILGQAERLGRVRTGYAADLILVNGNPLEDFKVLYPAKINGGGIEWTVKDGIPYHVPTLTGDIKKMVAAARALRAVGTKTQ